MKYASVNLSMIVLFDTAGPEEEVVQGAAKSHTESSVPPVTTHQPQDASGIFEETGKQIKIFAQCIQRTQEAGRSLRAGMDQNERLWTARMDVMNECLVPLKSCLDELYSMYTKHRELCNFFQQLLLIGEFLDIADHQLSKFMKDEFAAKNSGVLIIKESLEGQRETWNKIMQIIQPLIQEEASKQVRGKAKRPESLVRIPSSFVYSLDFLLHFYLPQIFERITNMASL